MRLARLLGFTIAAVVVTIGVTGCSSDPAAAAAGASTNGPASPRGPNAPQATGTAAPSTPQRAGATIQLGTGGVDALVAAYSSRCKTETVESLECEALRSLLVAEVTTGLLKLEKSGDQRATDEALGSLDLLDEPEILIAAMRVLGHFPETQNLAARVVPLLLESPYIQVQRMAADVLIANPDEQFQNLGRIWSEGHDDLRADSVYDEYPDFPTHYDAIGFPLYAGAEWFSPGDSDRSIGWSTKDDVATVARFFADTLHTEALDLEKWNQVFSQQTLVLMKPVMDPARMAKMQQLMERLMKGEQAAQAELEKLSKETDAAQKIVDVVIEKSISKNAYVPGTFAAGARWLIAGKKGERISKLVIVFPIPSIQRTGIKLVWDLSDYPSAWPEAKKEKGQ